MSPVRATTNVPLGAAPVALADPEPEVPDDSFDAALPDEAADPVAEALADPEADSEGPAVWLALAAGVVFWLVVLLAEPAGEQAATARVSAASTATAVNPRILLATMEDLQLDGTGTGLAITVIIHLVGGQEVSC
jgi:hypothetical protein